MLSHPGPGRGLVQGGTAFFLLHTNPSFQKALILLELREYQRSALTSTPMIQLITSIDFGIAV